MNAPLNTAAVASDTAKMVIRVAFSTGPSSNTALKAEQISFAQLAEVLSKATVGRKDGSYYIRGGELQTPKRDDDNLLSADLLILDGDSSIDPLTGEIVRSAPSMEAVTAALKDMGLAYVAHSSHSYEPGKLEKWRVVLPAKMKHKTDLKACASFVVARLHARGLLMACVKEMTVWSQPWYFPRVRDAEALSNFKYEANLDGSPFCVSDAIHWYVTNGDGDDPPRQDEPGSTNGDGEDTTTTAEPEPAKGNAKPSGKGNMWDSLFPSVIAQFNAEHGLEWVRGELTARGYKFSHHVGGKNQWRYIAPGSETGIAGVTVYMGKRGDWCVYSHHGAHDPLSHKAFDPFDLYALFYHGGDRKTAARVLWEDSNKSAGNSKSDKTSDQKQSNPGTGASDEDPEAKPAGDGAGEEVNAPGLIMAGKKPASNVANVITVLRTAPEWQGVFALDELAGKLMLLAPIPDASGRRPNSFEARPFADCDIIKTMEWFQHKVLIGIRKEVVTDGILVVATERGYDPLKDKLRSLVWDGVSRLDNWLAFYCGAPFTDTQPEAYVQAVGRRWLISAVARAFLPGCKVDSALVLVGKQGAGKSRLVKTLAYNAAWFSDAMPPINSKDASDHLRGRWIIEFAEMWTLTRHEAEEFKAFMTRDSERFRPAYGRFEIEYPRRCVFLGSTNSDSFLKDNTGNRRFWPVTVETVDLARLVVDRDQLWAEAVHAFDKGEQWHLTEEESKLATVQQKAFAVVDERAAKLASKLGPLPTTTLLKCCDMLEMPNDRRSQLEVSSMLRDLGWTRKHTRAGNFWHAPDVNASGAGRGPGEHPDRSFG